MLFLRLFSNKKKREIPPHEGPSRAEWARAQTETHTENAAREAP